MQHTTAVLLKFFFTSAAVLSVNRNISLKYTSALEYDQVFQLFIVISFYVIEHTCRKAMCPGDKHWNVAAKIKAHSFDKGKYVR